MIFLINVPIAARHPLVALAAGRPRQKRREDLQVDFVGAVLGAAGLGLLVAGFIEQPQLGCGNPFVPAARRRAALLAAFVTYELRTPMPMLPLRLFRLRNFSVTNIETLSVYGALSGLSPFLTLFLIEFAGYSPLHAGLALVPITIVMFFLSPRTGGRDAMTGRGLSCARADPSRGERKNITIVIGSERQPSVERRVAGELDQEERQEHAQPRERAVDRERLDVGDREVAQPEQPQRQHRHRRPQLVGDERGEQGGAAGEGHRHERVPAAELRLLDEARDEEAESGGASTAPDEVDSSGPCAAPAACRRAATRITSVTSRDRHVDEEDRRASSRRR